MKLSPKLEQFRVRAGPLASPQFADYGAFLVPGPFGRDLSVISSGTGEQVFGWEHVSVSLPNRCPNWPEMCYIKDLFWDQEETVMQLHPPKSKWINNHPHCLHLWRPLQYGIPLPPDITVGRKEDNL